MRNRPLRAPCVAIALAGALLTACSAEASTSKRFCFLPDLLIDNGLAPPWPENVVDADDELPLYASVVVADLGCACGRCDADHAPTVAALVGGEVWDLGVGDTSGLLVHGGHAEHVTVYGWASLVMTGGSASQVTVNYAGSLDLVGGVVASGIAANQSAVVQIRGSAFAVDGKPVPLGAVEALSGMLTGTLASGDSLSVRLLRDDSATVTLAPEPAAPLLRAGAAAALLLLVGLRRPG